MAWVASVIVTGGTANLGYYTALNIAREHPDYLIVISSRTDKGHAADSINKTLNQDNIIFIPIDLSNLANVRKYAEEWVAEARPPIQSLCLNAGLQLPGPLTNTTDGIEFTFGVNHVGHALLFHLLCPYLTDTARIVITASGTHDPAQKTLIPDAVYNTAEDLAHPPASMKDIPGRQRYSSSKLANVMWGYVLDRHLAQQRPARSITANSFDPGLMPGTGLAREANGFEKFLWMRVMPRILPLVRAFTSPNTHTPETSGAALARLAVGKDVEGVTGKYFEGLKPISSSKDSYNQAKQDDLWLWTVNYLAQSDDELARFQELE